MAKPEESRSVPSLQVRGTVDVEKFKAARVLGGEEVRFELRAMKPVRPGVGRAEPSCIVCIICIICIVCSAEVAQKYDIPGLAPLTH
jgi:hypothetical protein